MSPRKRKEQQEKKLEDKQSKIQKSIAASKAKYLKIKTKRDLEKQELKKQKEARHHARQRMWSQVKEGLEYYNNNQDKITINRFEIIDGLEITYSIREHPINGCPENDHKIVLSFAIKSPTDKWNEEIGIGLCSYRLKTGNEKFTYFFVRPLQPEILERFVEYYILAKLYSFDEDIPQRVKKILLKEVSNSTEEV